jgi:hypothetical protein
MMSTASGIIYSLLQSIKNDEKNIKQDQQSLAGLLNDSSPSCLRAALPEPIVIKAANRLSDMGK